MASKTINYMKEYSVEELLNEFSFYVPEIQREYVWGRNDRNILSAFCNDIIEGKKQAINETQLQQKISKLTEEKKFSEIAKLLGEDNEANQVNIGFIYSYEPNYKMEHFPDSDIYKDSYLIDGQQRFTSLFLILFYLSIKEDRRTDFISLLRYDYEMSTIAFDYRVRAITHDFVINLIKNTNNLADIGCIEDAKWYSDTYKFDQTVQAMVNAITIIEDEFKDVNEAYYDFILRQIKFWHFKTDKTNQGEELYITMNSRGKQLEENETVRAKLFEDIDDLEQTFWSEKWENWQDYFWKNRGRNGSADEGFNEFLKCIAGLEAYLNGKNKFAEGIEQVHDGFLIENLSLKLIDTYFDAFIIIFSQQLQFRLNYTYSAWVDDCLEEISDLIFLKEKRTNWFVNYRDENKATERRRMVFLWSILLYIKEIGLDRIVTNDLFRLLRVYWLRYNNLDRAVASISERITYTIEHGLWMQKSTKEEELKHSFLLKFKADEVILRSFESKIWKIEDHPLNLDGYQVENVNSIHLIDYLNLTEVNDLDVIYDKFVSLFNDKEVSIELNNVLMYYGFYGVRKTPYYYFNYDFGNWRRIIRDLDNADAAFKTFFIDYDGRNLRDILDKRKSEFVRSYKKAIIESEKIVKCDSFLDTIRFYIFLNNNIWKNGRHIAYFEWESPKKAITSFEKTSDKNIPNRLLFNTKGTFKGYFGYAALNEDLPSNYNQKLISYVNN